jgi:hypothetical protein
VAVNNQDPGATVEVVDTVGMTLLPQRPQHRFMGVPNETETIPFVGRKGGGDGGDYSPAELKGAVYASDFEQSLVKAAGQYAAGLTDYVYISLRDRGPNLGQDYRFKFLVNPENITVNHQTVDAESLTRSGPQVGLWGDTTDITISGQSAGRYFAGSLVSIFAAYSKSYQNLTQLQMLYENNGYWFEGETAADPNLPQAYAVKQIQLQADIWLGFGNFLWGGCFRDFSIEENADNPFTSKFSFSFVVWKERYKKNSAWRNSIESDRYYGHAYELYPTRKAADQPPPAPFIPAGSLGASPLAPSLGSLPPAGGFTGLIPTPTLPPPPQPPKGL